MKTLSIIVPAFNMEGYLDGCCESLMLPPALLERLEVIVVNDGSSDRTGEIAGKYALRHPAVFRAIDKSNGHYGSCINAALAVASGAYVKILDADDTFDTAALADLVLLLNEAVRSPAPPDLVITPVARVDRSGRTTSLTTYNLPAETDFGMAEITACIKGVTMHALTYKRAILEGYRQTEGVNYTDTEWCFAPMARVRTARYMPKPVYRYLVDREGQSMAFESVARNFGDCLAILDGMCARRGAMACDGAHARYLDAWLARFAALGYRTIVRTVPWHAAARLFGEWDGRVKRGLPALYDALGEEPFSARLRWRFVRAFRRSGKSRAAKILLLRAYARAVAALGR